MQRIIIDYKKLTPELLEILVVKFPERYISKDVISFKNSRNETIEALEVRTEKIVYLIKVGKKLAQIIESDDLNFLDDSLVDFSGDE